MYSKMVHPLTSTVTYLTDEGGPTMVFNMITPDGNSAQPEIPDEAYLVFPKKNRHTLFNGNLQHGVISELSLKSNPYNPKRITFLINW